MYICLACSHVSHDCTPNRIHRFTNDNTNYMTRESSVSTIHGLHFHCHSAVNDPAV